MENKINNKIRQAKKPISIFLLVILNLQLLPLNLLANRFILNENQIKVIERNRFPVDKIMEDCNPEITSESNRTVTRSIVSKAKKIKSKVILNEGGGPTTPEVQGFTQASSDNLVNLSTGDFNYSIPLMDVGGYPVAINYNSQVQMNDEASWVGLGWSLNAGSVNRNVRGLPDDFKDEVIRKEVNIKQKITDGIGIGLGVQYAGFEAGGAKIGGGINLSMEIENDNYEGYGVNLGIGANARAGNSSFGGTIGMDIGISSNKGASLSPNLSLSGNVHQTDNVTTKLGAGVGMTLDSREGLKSISYGINASTSLNRVEDFGMHGNPFSFNGRYSHSFALPSYSPVFEIPYSTYTERLKFTIGAEVQSVHINLDEQINKHRQSIQRQIRKKAFGYLYTQHAGEDALLDFNRGNEGVYYRELPALPITNFTHDIYSVTAHGLSGSFRPMRNDIGILHSTYQKNTSQMVEGGAELGAGGYVHLGGNIVVDNGGEVTQKWTNGNGLANAFKFVDTIVGAPNYESAYFKNTGELSSMADRELFESLGGFEPIKANLHRGDDLSTADATNTLSNGKTFDNINNTVYKERKHRNKCMSFRTVQEIAQSGEAIHDYRYSVNNFSSGMETDFREDYEPIRSGDLIEELTVINEEGIKYQFGLPAYNNFIKEISFNINPEAQENGNGNVHIDGTEISINNQSGDKQYYSRTTTPAHAYAWLITGIFSHDYSDITRDGPSPDDLGTYTSFHYIKTHNNYLWRNPHQQDSAQFQEAKLFTKKDNSASLIYGGKEIYYLEKIKTRNYTAVFYSSPRRDAVGVNSIMGGSKTDCRLNKLDSIKLYASYTSTENAVPIKTVYFEYDYSLCIGNPSTLPALQNGKLTLKRISFSYQNSSKHKESPFVFNYGFNPSYNGKANDRWGNYKPNIETGTSLPNDRFPYVNQNKSVQDIMCTAWLLNEIKTPIGGKMNIAYESDDYAFVQNAKAMNMYKLLGFSNSSDGPISNDLRRVNNPTKYLFFEIPVGISNNIQLYKMLEGIHDFYYNVKVQLTPERDGHPAQYEYIEGFMPLNFAKSDSLIRFGFRTMGGLRVGWIKLKIISAQGQDVFSSNEEYPYVDECTTSSSRLGLCLHPFSLGAYEFIATEEPRLIKPNHSEVERTVNQAFTDLEATFNEVFAQGVYNYLANSNRANFCDPNESFIRLNNPFGRKLGGGVRVKRIEINDRWDEMQFLPSHGQKSAVYGVEYDYSIEGQSSGVASYEPIIGKDENALVVPIPYRRIKKNAIDISNYQLEPLGEIFYPFSQITYSKVKQKNITKELVNQHATGYTIHEFFTSKDFPVKTKWTDKFPVGKEFMLPFQIYNRSETAEVVSQGFCVELNNMNGVLKKVSEYDQFHNLISSTENIYKLKDDGSLDNEVATVNGTNGEINTNLVGIDYECIIHADNYITFQEGGGVQLNIDVFPAGPIPFPLIVPVPVINQFYTEFRGITITKLITRVGILEKVRTMKLGSISESENIAYDKLTGKVIVTKVDNEFNNKYYTTELPAYWAYPEMGASSMNNSLRINNVLVTSPAIQFPDAYKYFKQGDQCIAFLKDHSSLGIRLWVYKVEGNTIYFIKDDGSSFGTTSSLSIFGFSVSDLKVFDFYILKSAYKNQLSESVGSFIATSNPIDGDRLNLTSAQMLQSSATEYSDYWQTELSFLVSQQAGTCKCEPQLMNDKTGKSASAKNGIPYSIDFRNQKRNARYEANRVTFFDSLRNCSMVINTADGMPFEDSTLQLTFFVPTQAIQDCGSTNYLVAKYKTNKGLREVIMSTDCWELINCKPEPRAVSVDCGRTTGLQNPFLQGILGNFRPLTSYAFHTKRNTGRIDQSGFMLNYEPFWKFNESKLSKNRLSNNWQRSDSIVAFNSRGGPIETWNALNIPSSVQYNFGKSLLCAQSANASYTDIAFDGYEDYLFDTRAYSLNCIFPSHFSFILESRVDFGDYERITDRYSHTGNYSLEVLPTSPAQYKYPCYIPLLKESRENRTRSNEFRINSADILLPFQPKKNVNYIFSAWVHVRNKNLSTFERIASIEINGTNYQASGPIIDEWQQIKGNFILPESATNITINLKASSTETVYFDDLRIQPNESMMENSVFSSDFFRLKAKLDDLNYASFFEYDAEGKLERTKKETEIGIYTIQEVKTELPKGLNNR